tara:strand:- start:4707 stop:5333 length:627 start_codon:yes stop_codon:yes gene_type:complete
MRTFKVYHELEKFIEHCGGEETVRWIARKVGSKNWETTKIHPIVAWNEKYTESPVIIGIAIRVKKTYQIIASVQKSEKVDYNNWIKSISGDEIYFDVASALLNNKNAIIASETDIIDGEILGWQHVINQVMENKRSNGLTKNKNSMYVNENEIDMDEFEELVSYFENDNLLNDFINILKQSIKNISIADFDNTKSENNFSSDFQDEWA